MLNGAACVEKSNAHLDLASSSDSMNLLQKVESGMGCPVWQPIPSGTQPCTVFGYKDFCGPTVLGTPESVGMNGQIDWQALQISHLVCSLAGQRCSEA